MKLNDREKKLIFIVVGVILIALSYFIGYRKISAANNKLDDKIASLQRFKDSVKEVAAGFECGITLERFSDLKDGVLRF